jgi:hypothetical protein
MSKRPQGTSAEEPDGGNPHIRFRGGPRRGNRPGLLNNMLCSPGGMTSADAESVLTLFVDSLMRVARLEVTGNKPEKTMS